MAIVARAHAVPFYVAAPFSTVDFNLASEKQIRVKERDASEIYRVNRKNPSPPNVKFYNSERDITPARLITAIITEKGAIAPNALLDYHTAIANED